MRLSEAQATSSVLNRRLFYNLSLMDSGWTGAFLVASGAGLLVVGQLVWMWKEMW